MHYVLQQRRGGSWVVFMHNQGESLLLISTSTVDGAGWVTAVVVDVSSLV